MNVKELVSGKISFELPALPKLVLVVPKAREITRLTPSIIRKVRDYMSKLGYDYTSLDAETDLLKTFPDYYDVLDQAQTRKNNILLQLTEEDTPDERFLKTPDEVAKMEQKELEEYYAYYKKQYNVLEKKFLEDKIIRKSIEYERFKYELYAQTVDGMKQQINKIYWLVAMAEDEDGKPYFKDLDSGFKSIMNLDMNEFTLLMDVWNGLSEGFSLPF